MSKYFPITPINSPHYGRTFFSYGNRTGSRQYNKPTNRRPKYPQGPGKAGQSLLPSSGVKRANPFSASVTNNKRRKSSKKPVRKTGYGPYRFRKGKKPRQDKYARSGVTLKYENGGVVSDSKTVVIGHSTNPQRYFVEMVMAAIIKQLVIKAQWAIKDLSTIVFNSAHNIRWTYYPSVGSSTPIERTVSVSVSESIRSMAEKVYADITTASVGDFMHLKSIALFDETHELSSLNFDGMTVSWACYSLLNIQNTSKAGLSGASEEDDDDAGDITQNPLIGRSYDTFGNCFIPRDRVTAGTPAIFLADEITGVIPRTGHTISSSEDSYNLNTVPPPYYFNKCRKSVIQKLQVGEIKSSRIKHSGKMNFHTFFDDYKTVMKDSQASSLEVPNKIGYSRVFAFEKVLDARQGENQLKIDYEINYTLKIHVSSKQNTTTLPYLVIA